MHAAATSDRWIMRPRRLPGARLRLFCLPHAGGGASMFREWAQHLPEVIEVCPIQLPGRETRIREKALDELEPLVRALTDAVTPWLDRPYGIFGHSVGALIGFELGRALRAAGLPQPAHLFLSGRTAPQHQRVEPEMWNLSDAALIENLRELGGAREEVLAHQELMELLLPTVRADLAVAERYVFPGGDPLDVPITALAGRDDRRAPPAALEGWAEQTRGRFRLHVFSGGHFFVQSMPGAVCRVVAEELARLGDTGLPPASTAGS
jgi:medium-chain acyl-[acyl-carrier-protein] hydrolase